MYHFKCFSLLDGHASKQQVSSVQEGEFGVKCPVVPEQDGRQALTYTWSSDTLPNFPELFKNLFPIL